MIHGFTGGQCPLGAFHFLFCMGYHVFKAALAVAF